MSSVVISQYREKPSLGQTDKSPISGSDAEINDDVDQVRRKYRSHRRGSLLAGIRQHEDEDDDDLNEEIDRLGQAQFELQAELKDVMQMVHDQDIEVVEEKPEIQPPKASFARNFFRMNVREERQLQLRLFKRELRNLDEDLEAVVDCQLQTQAQMVERVTRKAPVLSLKQEKKRQLALLKEKLQSMEPGLEEVMQAQHETQQSMIAKQHPRSLWLPLEQLWRRKARQYKDEIQKVDC